MLFFKILLEYQFFSEMLKQVRGSMNDYEDTLVFLKHGPFFSGGRRGRGVRYAHGYE